MKILELSNTQIRKIKRGDLVDHVIALKAALNTKEIGSNADMLGIELKDTKDRLAKSEKTRELILSDYKTLVDKSKVLGLNLIDYKRQVKVLRLVEKEYKAIQKAATELSWWGLFKKIIGIN